MKEKAMQEIFRRIGVKVVALSLATLGVLGITAAAAPSASAVAAPVTYAPQPGVDCRFDGNTIQFVVRPPTIYGINFNAGGGNDWQWVHFRSRVINMTTGATVATTGWSAWAPSYDNRAAQYSGVQSASVVRNGQAPGLQVKVDVEWWSQTERLFASTILNTHYNTSVHLAGLGWANGHVQRYC